MATEYKMEGYIDYPGVGRITDEDVWKLVEQHSRPVDRSDPRKMTEMVLLGQCVLMGIIDDKDPKDPSWMFFDDNGCRS